MATKKNAKAAVKEWKHEAGWKQLDKGEEKVLEAYCQDYLAFISANKTERLVCASLKAAAVKQGFKDIETIGNARLKPGAKVFRTIDDKTILMAIVGKAPLEEGLNLVGAHGDCPRLDLKPCPLYEDGGLVLLDTHYYGGIKKYQWVTIPLALYGVVVRRDGTKVTVAIGDKPGDPVFTITDLLPHLDIEQYERKMREAIKGEKLNVVFGSRPAEVAEGDKNAPKKAAKHRILQLLAQEYGIEEEDFASAELEVVPAGAARELGFDRSMLLGYGQDDRVCAYAAARAVLDYKGIPARTIGALVCDKEEIGSVGRTGMDSTFLANTVAELLAATAPAYSDLALRRCLEHTKMLSADVGSLYDPDYANAFSPNDNQGKLNCGILISKYDGARGKSGASDASAELVAQVRRIFNEANVAWQMSELGKVDVGGGGTISLYMAHYGIQVLDCGVGLLCMHAPWEISGKLDAYMAYKGYAAFLEKAS